MGKSGIKTTLCKTPPKPHRVKMSHVGYFSPYVCLKDVWGFIPYILQYGAKNPYTVNHRSLVVQNLSIKLDLSSLLYLQMCLPLLFVQKLRIKCFYNKCCIGSEFPTTLNLFIFNTKICVHY